MLEYIVYSMQMSLEVIISPALSIKTGKFKVKRSKSEINVKGYQ